MRYSVRNTNYMAIKLLFSKINEWERIIFIYFFLGGGVRGANIPQYRSMAKKESLTHI